MKSLLWTIALITAPTLAAEEMDSSRDMQLIEKTEQARENASTEDRVVIITDAEFVPFSQYLGLSDVNKLPPSSAGNPKPAQHRMP